MLRLTFASTRARVLLGRVDLPLAVASLTWCLPSSILGAVAGAALLCFGARVIPWRGLPVVHAGSTLGPAAAVGHVLVFLGSAPEQVREHEWGHASQSVALGPLYWLLVALPSLAHACLFALSPGFRGHHRYLGFYTEAWAQLWAETRHHPLGWR